MENKRYLVHCVKKHWKLIRVGCVGENRADTTKKLLPFPTPIPNTLYLQNKVTETKIKITATIVLPHPGESIRKKHTDYNDAKVRTKCHFVPRQ
jgi:hypothetical protein